MGFTFDVTSSHTFEKLKCSIGTKRITRSTSNRTGSMQLVKVVNTLVPGIIWSCFLFGSAAAQQQQYPNYEEQKNINPRRVEGTCQWALQSAEYIRWWESSTNDLLWVSADPGCGKSVLARSIIDDELQTSSSTVTTCYFFFKDNDEQNRLNTALCSTLHQIFSQRPHLLSYALPSYEKNGEKLQHEFDELWRIFITAASSDVPRSTIKLLRS